jgi:hypothetical protein
MVALLPPSETLTRVPRPLERSQADTVTYHGEVWTDGRGLATVRLPAGAGPIAPPLAYELRDLDPPSSARVTAGLKHGRFTIATGEPHVKVAWRIRGRRPAVQPDREQEEDT